MPTLDAEPAAEPRGDMEILGREPAGLRGARVAAAGILVVVLLAYAAPLADSVRPQGSSEVFNIFAKVKDACEKDDGSFVTADPQGTPMAFASPDGPQRYWCVSRAYLSSIGQAPQDPLPPLPKIPHEYKWLWPRTSYGQ